MNKTLLMAITSLFFMGLSMSTNAQLQPSHGTEGVVPGAVAKEKTVDIVIVTNQGIIEASLDNERAPISVANFRNYIKNKFYDGTIFHRVIPNFMIQGGGFTKDLQQKSTHATIKNEAGNGLKNRRGTLAMARTSDINSATTQFFINSKDNGFLDHSNETPGQFGYAVFGKVTKGMDVLDKISAVTTTNNARMRDVPVEAVVIKSIREK